MTRKDYRPNMPVLVEDIQVSACERSMRICGVTDGDYYQKENKQYYAIVRLDNASTKQLRTHTREYPLARLQPIRDPNHSSID